jgi:hypothetical protein
MLNLLNLDPDETTDDIGMALSAFREIPTWTKEKKILCDAFIELLKKNKYEELLLNSGGYKLRGIGSSGIYKVPTKKKGLLSKYEGQTLRLVCVGTSRFYKVVMIKKIENKGGK